MKINWGDLGGADMNEDIDYSCNLFNNNVNHSRDFTEPVCMIMDKLSNVESQSHKKSIGKDSSISASSKR